MSDNILKNNGGIIKSFNSILDDRDLKLSENIKSILLALNNDVIFKEKNLSVSQSRERIRNLIQEKEILKDIKRKAILSILDTSGNGQDTLFFIKQTNEEISKLDEDISFFNQVETFLNQQLNQYQESFLKEAIQKYVQEQNRLKEKQKEQEEYNEYALDIAKSVLDDLEDVNTWLLKTSLSTKSDGEKVTSNREPKNVDKVKTVSNKSKKQSSEKVKLLKTKIEQNQIKNKLKSNTQIPKAQIKSPIDKTKELKDQNIQNNNPKEKEQIKTESKPVYVTLIQDPDLNKTDKKKIVENKILDLKREQENLEKRNIDKSSSYLDLLLNELKLFFSEEWILNTGFQDPHSRFFSYTGVYTREFKSIYLDLFEGPRYTQYDDNYESYKGTKSLLYKIFYNNELYNYNQGLTDEGNTFFKSNTLNYYFYFQYSRQYEYCYLTETSFTKFETLMGNLFIKIRDIKNRIKNLRVENIFLPYYYSSKVNNPGFYIEDNTDFIYYGCAFALYDDVKYANTSRERIKMYLNPVILFYFEFLYPIIFNDRIDSNFFNGTPLNSNFTYDEFLKDSNRYFKEIIKVYKEDQEYMNDIYLMLSNFSFDNSLLSFFDENYLNKEQDPIEIESTFLKLAEYYEYTIIENTRDSEFNERIGFNSKSPTLLSSFEHNYLFSNEWLELENAKENYVNPFSYVFELIKTRLLIVENKLFMNNENFLFFLYQSSARLFGLLLPATENSHYFNSDYLIDINRKVETSVYNEYVFNSLGMMNQTLDTLSFDNKKSELLKNSFFSQRKAFESHVFDLFLLFNLFIFETKLKERLSDNFNEDLNSFINEFKTDLYYVWKRSGMEESSDVRNCVNVKFNTEKFYDFLKDKEDSFTNNLLSNIENKMTFLSKKTYELNIDYRYNKINSTILDIYYAWRCLTLDKRFWTINNISLLERDGPFFNKLFEFEKNIMEWNSAYSAMFITRFGGFFDKIKQYEEQEIPVDGIEGNYEWSKNLIEKGSELLDFIWIETGNRDFPIEEDFLKESITILKATNYLQLFENFDTDCNIKEGLEDYKPDFISLNIENFDDYQSSPEFLYNSSIDNNTVSNNYHLYEKNISGFKDDKKEYLRALDLKQKGFDIDSIYNFSNYWGNSEYMNSQLLYDFFDYRHSAYYKFDYSADSFFYSYSLNLSQMIMATQNGLRLIDAKKVLNAQNYIYYNWNDEKIVINDIKEIFSFCLKFDDSVQPNDSALWSLAPKNSKKIVDENNNILGGINWNLVENETLQHYFFKLFEVLSYGVVSRYTKQIEDSKLIQINPRIGFLKTYICRFLLLFNKKIDWNYIFSDEGNGTLLKLYIFKIIYSILNNDDTSDYIFNMLSNKDNEFTGIYIDFESYEPNESKAKRTLKLLYYTDYCIFRRNWYHGSGITFPIQKNKHPILIHTEKNKKTIKSVMSFFDLSFKHSFLTKYTMAPFLYTNVLTNNYDYNGFINGLNPDIDLEGSNPYLKLKHKDTDDEERNAILSFSDLSWCNFRRLNNNNIKINDYSRFLYYNSYGNLFDKLNANIVANIMFNVRRDFWEKGFLQFNIDPLKER